MLDIRIISIKKPHLREIIKSVMSETPPFNEVDLDRLLDELAVEHYDSIGDHERAAIIWCDIKEKPCQP